jgi:hypothetical protein
MRNDIKYLKTLKGSTELKFYTKSGLHIATGYDRLVIGKRGPYVEFENIITGNIYIPKKELYRLNNPVVYYDEYRTNDISNVKIYLQKKNVRYADYKIGKWYISPYDLEYGYKDNSIDMFFER